MNLVNFMVTRNSVAGYNNAYRVSNKEEILNAKTRTVINSMGGLTVPDFFASIMKFYESANAVDDFVSALTEEAIEYLSHYNPGFRQRLADLHESELVKTNDPRYRLGSFLSKHPAELGFLLSTEMNETQFREFTIHQTPLAEIMLDDNMVDATYEIVLGEEDSEKAVILMLEKDNRQYAGITVCKENEVKNTEASLIIDFYARFGLCPTPTWQFLKETPAWNHYGYEEVAVSDESRMGYVNFFGEMSSLMNRNISEALQLNSPYEISNAPYVPGVEEKSSELFSYATGANLFPVEGSKKSFLVSLTIQKMD